MAFIYDLLDQWNAAGTTFTGIKLNVTDSASAAGSLLMDLQVGGVSRFRVDKTGSVALASTLVGSVSFAPAITLGTGGFSGMVTVSRIDDANVNIGFGYDGLQRGAVLANNANLRWGSFGITFADLFLFRDAANTLAQRNGVNAQAFNLYNTYTDASNYERGFMRFVSNVMEIGAEALGTGTARTVRIRAGNSAWSFEPNAATSIPGTLRFIGSYSFSVASGVFTLSNESQTGGATFELREQTAPAAPATDRVRIYAEDNGAGKTRLMALFPTGVAQQIAIEP